MRLFCKQFSLLWRNLSFLAVILAAFLVNGFLLISENDAYGLGSEKISDSYALLDSLSPYGKQTYVQKKLEQISEDMSLQTSEPLNLEEQETPSYSYGDYQFWKQIETELNQAANYPRYLDQIEKMGQNASVSIFSNASDFEKTAGLKWLNSTSLSGRYVLSLSIR